MNILLIHLSIAVRLLMHLNKLSHYIMMETVVYGFFYGTLAGHYLWFKREEIYQATKQTITSVARTAWTASKQAVLARINRRKQKEETITKRAHFDDTTIEEEDNQGRIEKKKSEIIYTYKISKEKKIRKSDSKPQNIVKKMRDYEDWVLNNKQLRTMKDSPILIEQQLKRIKSHKFNEQTMMLIEKENEEDEDEVVSKIVNEFKTICGRSLTDSYNPIIEKGDYDRYKSPLDVEIINLTSSNL